MYPKGIPIKIVTSSICPYCTMAKDLISSLWFEYEEVVVEMWTSELMDIVQKTGMMTVPQIFIWEVSKENLLWGYTDIEALHNEGKLVDLFKKAS